MEQLVPATHLQQFQQFPQQMHQQNLREQMFNAQQPPLCSAAPAKHSGSLRIRQTQSDCGADVGLQAADVSLKDRRLHAQLRKTKLCSYYIKGTCSFAEKCNFAHFLTELQAAPDLRHTRFCKAYQVGACYNPNCSFAHAEQEMVYSGQFYKKSLCKWHAKGICWLGDECRFAHGIDNLRVPPPHGADHQETGSAGSYAFSAPSPMPYVTSNVGMPRSCNSRNAFQMPGASLSSERLSVPLARDAKLRQIVAQSAAPIPSLDSSLLFAESAAMMLELDQMKFNITAMQTLQQLNELALDAIHSQTQNPICGLRDGMDVRQPSVLLKDLQGVHVDIGVNDMMLSTMFHL